MTAPATDHARALQIVDATCDALEAHFAIRSVSGPTDILTLIRERSLPLVVEENEINWRLGSIIGTFADGEADFPQRVDDGRFFVARRLWGEDGSERLEVNRRYAFVTREDCDRFIVSGYLLSCLKWIAELPDTTEHEYWELLDRLGYEDIVNFRTARVGCVDTSVAEAA